VIDPREFHEIIRTNTLVQFKTNGMEGSGFISDFCIFPQVCYTVFKRVIRFIKDPYAEGGFSGSQIGKPED
jgi:hypothetical protein